MFWALGIISLVMGTSAGAQAADAVANARSCLSYGDTAEVVASRKVIAPGEAIVAARHAVPDGDILRASLCRKSDALVYRLTAIRADGRVVQVTVDAPSGKVQMVH
ncbi:PepSY domain-containing protein [Enterovirga sp.]|uniref:PepSY domain-containing protein n=1 Tax=Enterovirga sp. TaxID=2026350 RepID=UPI002C47B3E8|nr:PepSY domain-containing protein [Enterovirga sp.]HMO30879.1 hypothetical protein [Enterovirga sp.]